METSAPKRRRTSPRTALPLQPEPESTTPRDALPRPGSSPSRPSFASPTRASLERFNPEILRRRGSQPRKLRSSPDAPPSPSRATTPDSTRSLTRAMRTQLELRSGARDGGARALSDGDSLLRSPARRVGPNYTPTRPTPRPLPPPAPEEDDELLRAITTRVNPAASLGVLPEVVAPEPELPPTPEHPDPVVSTPPSGIHNTPSRRPKRSRTLAERIKSSSPLKQPPLRPPELSKKGAVEISLPTQASKAPASGPQPQAATTAELRGLKPADPDAEKKKLRDSLLADIARLERDLDLASHENERIRQARLAKRNPSPPTNPHELLDLLTRHVLPPEDQTLKPDPVQSWLASALNPIAFLPFSKPSPSGPPILPSPSTAEATPPLPVSHHPLPMTADEALPYLQVFTPLTFASHVSPLPPPDTTTTAATDGPTPPPPPPPPLLQQHIITATSTSPRGLFAARIEMTVNTKTMAIASLAVPKLDPAAEGELRPFVARITQQQQQQQNNETIPASSSSSSSSSSGFRSGVHNNVSVLAWGMGEWLRVAVERAKAWIVLEREVGGDKDALRGMVGRWRARGERLKRGRRRRRKGEEGGGEGSGGSEDEEDDVDGRDGGGSVDGGTAGNNHDVAALLPYMGRTSLDLEVPVLDAGEGEVSALRVQWRITFDWTGEARSDIGVLVSVPGKWHKHDERGQLSGLPKLFEELIQRGEDPLAAVRTVVCLLAGEGK